MNYNTFVETVGTSGGTESLMSLMIQLGESLEQKGMHEEAGMVKDLANLGYNIAKIETEYEPI